MKTIGIVGCRARSSTKDYLAISKAFIKVYDPGDRIVSGGCPKGADQFAKYIAEAKGIAMITYYPGPDKPASYFRRNALVAMEADVLIACVSADRTGGTEDTIDKFRKFKHKDAILV